MKGQGLSITTIVVAAIALLVLVVLVAVFTGQFGGFAQGTRDCNALQGAQCLTQTDVDQRIANQESWSKVPGRRCSTEEIADSKECFVRVGN